MKTPFSVIIGLYNGWYDLGIHKVKFDSCIRPTISTALTLVCLQYML